MKTKNTAIITILTAIVAVASAFMPCVAFADTSYTVSSKAEFMDAVNAINAASTSSNTITLNANIDLGSDTAEFSKNITSIIGNGHSITGANADQIIKVSSGATLSLNAGSSSLNINGAANYNKAPIFVTDDGSTLNMASGVMLSSSETFTSSMAGGVYATSNSTFNLNGGTIQSANGKSAGGVYVGGGRRF